VFRIVSVIGGIVLITITAVAGVDGETRMIGGALIAFGLGIPIGQVLEKKKLARGG
jgi:hypothetical protein